jgi:nitrite reductase/ring-hydroxylating ferredoxin subunit
MRLKIGTLSELKPGNWIEKRILTRRIAVYNDNGTLRAIEADCKHMKASLARGTVRDGTVTCEWHGWQYNLTSGQCLTNPEFRLKTYDVETVDGEIYIHL